MTDQEFMADWLKLLDAPDDFEDLEPWQEARERMRRLLPALDARLRAADEAELAQVQARAAAIAARLGVSAPQARPAAPARPAREPQPIDETDAGAGIGNTPEGDVSRADFRSELASLRDRTTEKRRRLS